MGERVHRGQDQVPGDSKKKIKTRQSVLGAMREKMRGNLLGVILGRGGGQLQRDGKEGGNKRVHMESSGINKVLGQQERNYAKLHTYPC